MARQFYRKDPSAVLDYEFDWSDWLQPGDYIVDHDVAVPGGLVKESSSIDPDAHSVYVWVSGGSVGATYPVVCEITTSGGRTDQQTMRILVEDQ